MWSTNCTGRAVYDRLFNVQQIAAASMGPNSVMLDPSAAADANVRAKLRFVLLLLGGSD